MEYPKSLQPLPKDATKVYKGFIFEIWQWQQKMFDGTIKTFEKAKRNPSVGVFPVTADNKIVLTIQSQPSMDPFISLIGGVTDDGEDVKDSAERELLEEAGLRANRIDFWYSIQPVTKIEWPIYIFIARDCQVVAKQNLDSGEKIELKYVNWDEFLEVVKQDNFRDTEISLKFLKAMQIEGEIEKIKKFIFPKI
ncbi:MAG: NUDIX hydrolase [Pseudomonadales bacterium]|nr:NUDIX hydrolase [Pseudomonadales bacterium]